MSKQALTLSRVKEIKARLAARAAAVKAMGHPDDGPAEWAEAAEARALVHRARAALARRALAEGLRAAAWYLADGCPGSFRAHQARLDAADLGLGWPWQHRAAGWPGRRPGAPLPARLPATCPTEVMELRPETWRHLVEGGRS